VDPWRVWGALSTLYIVWGSTYFAIAVMVETVPPLLGAGARFVLAGGIVLAWIRVRRGPGALRITRAQLGFALGIGAALVGGNAILTAAEQEVPSALAALIYAAIPLWVIVLRALARERIARTTALAVVIGFGGVALLLLPGEQTAGASSVALGACLAGSLVWSLGIFSGPRSPLSGDPLLATGWQMVLGGALWGLAGLAAGEGGDVHPDRFSAESVAAFAYLVVFGSLLAFTVLMWALEHLPLSRVATYPFVNPIVALALGALLRDEPVTPLALGAAVVIVGSVALVVRSERPSGS
jgi:drug/metabolite transporter (DMT)-like permease